MHKEDALQGTFYVPAQGLSPRAGLHNQTTLRKNALQGDTMGKRYGDALPIQSTRDTRRFATFRLLEEQCSTASSQGRQSQLYGSRRGTQRQQTQETTPHRLQLREYHRQADR